jgi:hypothetical protein
MLAASLALVPGWIPHWIEASLRDAGKMPVLVTIAGHRIGVVLCIALLVAVVIRIRRLASDPNKADAFVCTAALLLSATVCLIPSTAWMIYNDLLLIPAILVILPRLLSTRPAGLLDGLAQLGLFASIVTAPVCAALGLAFGYSAFVALSPSLVLFAAPLTFIGAVLISSPARAPAADWASEPTTGPALPRIG